MPETDEKPAFEGWAVLELMGHRRLGGHVSEATMFGSALCRIDVPEVDGQPAATQVYSLSAIYCLTPTTEAVARAVARGNRPAPVSRTRGCDRPLIAPGFSVRHSVSSTSFAPR